jgi:hypothetical protein
MSLFHMNDGRDYGPRWLKSFAAIGYVGVASLVLSGFIWCIPMPAAMNGRFHQARFARIYPASVLPPACFRFYWGAMKCTASSSHFRSSACPIGPGFTAAAGVASGSGAILERGGVEPFGGGVLLRDIPVGSG